MAALGFFRKHPDQDIVLCHSGKLCVETEVSVAAFAPDAQWIDTAGDPYLYRDALREHWNGTHDLVTIEQDIEITADVLPSFRKCRKEWCVFGYQGPPEYGYLYRSLGCTRFTTELQRRIPFEKFPADELSWNLMDAYMAAVFRYYGMNPHIHGMVNHYHDYLSDRDDYYHKLALQLEPDGTRSLYQNNPDGTRGAFVRKVNRGTWIAPGSDVAKGQRNVVRRPEGSSGSR